MSLDLPTARKMLRSVNELEPVIEGLRQKVEGGVYGEIGSVMRGRVQGVVDEGVWYISESRRVVSRILVLEERADRLFEEFERLAEELGG